MTVIHSRKSRRIIRPLALAGAFLFMFLTVAWGEEPADILAHLSETSCVQPASSRVASLQRVILLAEASRSKGKKSAGIPTKELIRPMKEKELRLLIRALEPVRAKDGKSMGIRMVAEGSELPPKRAAVLTGDAMALLLNVNTRETLGRLKKNPKADKALLTWFAYADQAVSFCARQRFEDRGGDRAYRRSLDLVQKFKDQLNPVILYGLNSEIFGKVVGTDNLPVLEIPKGGPR